MKLFTRVVLKESDFLDKSKMGWITFVRVMHRCEDYSLGFVLIFRLPSYWWGTGFDPANMRIVDEPWWWQRILFIRALHPMGWPVPWEWKMHKELCDGYYDQIRYAP